MKKFLSIALSFIMAITTCLCFGTFAFADTYSSVEAIQAALDQNKFDSSRPITVTVAPGTYNLNERIVIYSNTTFNCDGATFIKKYKDSTLIAIGQNQNAPTGNDYYKNITINGGTFDANKTTGSILSFAHASNVSISNATFKDCSAGHHLTFAGCNNINVTGCTFSGHFNASDDNMEALQLDILEPEHFPNYKDYPKSYDGTMNTNINITGNTFTNVNRGVGCHSVFSGKYMSGINISNNTFTNVAGYAVLASSFINTTINNNVITDCGSGIYYKSINPKNGSTERPNTYKCNGISYAPTVNASSQICNNQIKVVDTADATSKQNPYGIRLYGEVLGTNESVAVAGDYSAQNINVSGNTISINRGAMGIWLVGAKKNTISNNTVSFDNPNFKASNKTFGIRLENSSSNSIVSNTVSVNKVSYVESAVILDNSKSNTLSYNTISGAKKHGVNITKSSAVLTSNKITNNGEIGLFCYDGSKVTTNKNTIKSNKKHGIFVVNCKKGKSIFNNDTVSSNKIYGIALQNSTGIKISGAKVKSNGQYGIYLTQKSKASINKCRVSSNKKEGIYTTRKSTSNINNCTVSSNKGCGIYFTNKAKGSIKNTKVQKNGKQGIYLTKKVGKITISKVKYSANKGGKIKK